MMPETMSEESEPKYPVHARMCYTEGMNSPRSEKMMIDPTTFVTADLEKLRANAVAAEEQEARNRLFRYLRHDLSQVFLQGGNWSEPVPSVKQHVQKAESWNINQLAQEILSVGDMIEKLKQAKAAPILNHTREQLEDMFWNKKPLVSNANPNRSDSRFLTWEDTQERVEFEKEAHQILDEGLSYYEKLKSGYQSLLENLTEDAPVIISQKLSEMKQVCKDAKKLKDAMIKIASEYRKKGIIDSKEAVKYVENKERFATLQSRYIDLHNETTRVADPATLSIPQFPASLNLDERASEAWILDAAKCNPSTRVGKGSENRPQK